jgi:hypothetical protein
LVIFIDATPPVVVGTSSKNTFVLTRLAELTSLIDTPGNDVTPALKKFFFILKPKFK